MEMEEIRDLIKIVNDHTKRNLPLIDLKVQQSSTNKELNLFLGIKSGDFRTDSEASKGIYGSDDVDFKFRMLKSRLNRKLLNHLFFVEFTSVKRHRTDILYQECLDFLHFSRMLLKIGEDKISTRLLNRTIDLARASEFTDIMLACQKELRTVYANTYRPKLFQSLKDDITSLAKLDMLEEDANNLYYQIELMLNSNINNRKKSYRPIQNALKKLEKLAQDTNSYNILEKFIKLQIKYFELIGDYKSVLKFTEGILQKFEQGKINENRFDSQMIDLVKINALFKSGNLQKAIEFARVHEKEFEADFEYWLRLMEIYFLSSIHQKEYEGATMLLMKVLNHKHFKDCDELMNLKWTIFRAYMYFLTGNKILLKKFDFQQFIENTPAYQKELAPYNVAIIILQIMHKFDRELSDLHENLDALEDYIGKFLNNSFGKRTKILAKLLHKIANHNRDYEMIIAKSKYLEEKLKATKPGGNEFIDLEIVPYEQIWQIALKDLRMLQAIS